MTKLFQNKKLFTILCIALAIVLAAGAGILVWQLTKDDSANDSGTYTVQFVTNGGGKIESIEVAKGTVLSQTDLPVPSKQGELFLAWYTDQALTTPYWNLPIESDMTLYASYLQPTDDATVNELVESVIPFASTDFSVTVRSSIELTGENIGQYILLTVHYGAHANGDEIKLSVNAEGDGLYRIGGNFAQGGEYTISLVSNDITFDPDDQMLQSYGLTDALRILHFRIIGESYTEGELSDRVADIPVEAIVQKDSDSITVTGEDRGLIGATEQENGIIRVGEGDEISNYYKVVKIESASDEETTYQVRPAQIDEIYDHVFGYQWEDLDSDDWVINEEVKQQVIENIIGNEQLNNYITYLATAATYTPTYQSLSAQTFGDVQAEQTVTVVTPTVTFDVDLTAYNDKFVHILGPEKSKKFVKLSVDASYPVKLGKIGKMGNVEAEISMGVALWVYVGVGGDFEIGWKKYDIDCGSTTLTQTEISFGITLMTTDAKKKVDITDEIEAIYNSAKNPTPENLLEQYSELLNGNSTPIELFNYKIFDVPVLSLLYGAVEISIPVRFVVSLDVQASFSSYFTVLNGNDFGIKGDEDEGLRIICNSMYPRYKLRLELQGRMELRAGLELGFELSLAYDLASVSMNVQVGLYGELHGYFFYEVDRLSDYKAINKGGAYYFELGIYVEINLRAQVCKIKYKGGLWETKDSFCEAGKKEIVYGFVNTTTDVITMENGQSRLYLTDTDILDVYVFDITKERGDDNPKIVKDYPFKLSEFKWSFSNSNFEIHDGQIIRLGNYNYSTAFEAQLTLHYTGVQISFRDTLTKYVTVRCSRLDDTDWDMLGETVMVEFSLNDEILLSRCYPYGERISYQPMLYYSMEEDGTEVHNLNEHEREILSKAGLKYIRWRISEDTAVFATKDIVIEAEKAVIRPWKVTMEEEDGKIQTIEANNGEEIILPFPEKTTNSTARYTYYFLGWKAEDGAIYHAGKLFKLTKDLQLTPYYIKNVRYYTVTFDANGGTINAGDDSFSMMCAYGTVPYYPFDPVRESTEDARYVFAGWSPTLEPVTGDVTYKARWKEIKYHTVTFDAGAGQFDANGNKTVTVKVEAGQALTKADFPVDPYLKGEGGYYEFKAWSSAVSAGTIINSDVTYTASYKNELIRKTGIIISDGTNSEDIATFLDGANKVKGYTYTLNTEFYGNTLVITGKGLTVSGNASDINITVINTEVTLHKLMLEQNQRIAAVTATGKATINISGTVRLISNTDAEAIRGDNSGEYDPVLGEWSDFADADITIKGVGNEKSWLMVTGQAYGIAVYGALTVDSVDINIYMPTTNYTDPDEGWVYDMVALQVHNHPKGILTVNDSTIAASGGVVNVAWLDMTDSELIFRTQEFVPGTYNSGLHIMNYYALTEPETLIQLTNSHITFDPDIAISIIASLPGEDPNDSSDDVYYMINTSIEDYGFISSYQSLRDFLADVDAHGYSGMVVMDGKSSIE